MRPKSFVLVLVLVGSCRAEPQVQAVYGLNPFLNNGPLQAQKPVQFHTTSQKPINLANNPFFAQNSAFQHNTAQNTNNHQLQQNNIQNFILQSQNVTSGPLLVQTPSTTNNPINPFLTNQIVTLPPQSNDHQGKLPNIIQSASPASPGATITGNQNHQPLQPTHVTISDPDLKKNCLKSRGQFPSNSCNKYFNCWDGVVLEEECPPGTLFSEKGWCDHEYNVDCGQRSVSGIHQGIIASNLVDSIPQSVKKEPVHPISSQDNLNSKPCENANSQQQSSTTNQPSSTLVTLTPPAIFIASGSKCLKPRGQFASSSCNRYINCWDGLATEEECPKGTLFSEKGYCDYDYNVNCGQRTVIGIHQGSLSNFISDTNQQTPSIQPIPSLPSSVDSNQPISSNVPVSQTPQTIAMNQISLNPFLSSLFPTKDIPNEIPKEIPTTTALPEIQTSTTQNVISNQNQTVSNTTFKPVVIITDPSIKAKCVKPRGQYASSACNKYINCWDGVVTEEECPLGMLFSENGYCDYSYKVVCGNRTGGFVPVNSSDCPAPYGTFRDKSNCSRYYTCINNQIAAKYECPNALQYNDVIGVCDYSYRVDCTKDPLIFPPLRRNVEIKFPSDFAHPPADCIPGTAYRLNPHCTSAAICRKEYTEVVECPAGFAYDSVTDKCTLLHLARC